VSQRIYLLDTSVILPLVRGNALGRHIDPMARIIDPAVARSDDSE
jgi:hypothetical protein